MSSDIDLMHPETDACIEVFSSITWNYGPMFREAFGYWPAIQGKTGREASEILNRGVQHMLDDPDKYKDLEPSNGWGTYDDAIPTLQRAARLMAHWPDLIVAVDGDTSVPEEGD